MAETNMSQIYLISEDLLKLYSNITRNVGVDKVYPYIALAQPFYITPILGQPLVDELTTEIANNNLTDLNKALVIKIAPALALWVDYLSLRSMAYTITQKGVTKEKSENSDSISEQELAEFKLDIKNNAEQATELLISYLCNCRDNYPLWRPEKDCECEKYLSTEGSTEKPFKSLIYFPKKMKNICDFACK